MWKKVKLLKMSNFTFYHYVFYAICILKSFNSHISVAICSFFEFGTVSKWCIREWVKTSYNQSVSQSVYIVVLNYTVQNSHQKHTQTQNTDLTLYSIDTHLDASTTDSFENIVGKGGIGCNKQFLLFRHCFLLNQIIVSPFIHISDIVSLFAAELEKPKITITGKGLTLIVDYKNFTFVHFQGYCRQQNECGPKIKKKNQRSRKHCGKRRKCWLSAYSPITTMFPKFLFPRVVINPDCMVKD